MYRKCSENPETERLIRYGGTDTGRRPGCGECGAAFARGERVFSWAGPRGRETFVCRQCFCELFDELSIEEKAALAGSETVVVGACAGPN